MMTLLKEFKAEFRDRLLDLLWRQWTALGVMGHSKPSEQTVLDPEALLLITCTIGRHDPRLFDAMLDWTRINGRYLNVHRLRRMLKTQNFTGESVYSAVAATMYAVDPSAKWAQSAKGSVSHEEPLFFMDNGMPFPIMHESDAIFRSCGFLRERYESRSAAQLFPSDRVANLTLCLRAMLGISARCEIFTYLLLNKEGSPRAMAKICTYYPATISKAMADMNDSGYVTSRIEGRHRYYTLISKAWRDFLIGEELPVWITWPALFSALEQTWMFLQAPDFNEKGSLAHASALRRMLKASLVDKMAVSGLPVTLNDENKYAGDHLIPFFIDRMRIALNELSQQ